MGDNTEHTAAALAQDFIARWSNVTASELSTAQSFVRELCDLLGVDAPHPTPEQIDAHRKKVLGQAKRGMQSSPSPACTTC